MDLSQNYQATILDFSLEQCAKSEGMKILSFIDPLPSRKTKRPSPLNDPERDGASEDRGQEEKKKRDHRQNRYFQLGWKNYTHG